jgi:SAM-dependent methyltransferase
MTGKIMRYDDLKAAEKEGWNCRAGLYDDYTGQITMRAAPTLLAMAETAPGARLLDLGCGTGRVAGAAVALAAEAAGVDIAPAMIETARAAFPTVEFAVGDAEAIPHADDSFDAVIWSFGAMHAGSPETVLAEIARVLKPGGRVALSHWVGPPASPLFKVVFGTMQRLADMSVVPPSPPPFALSSEAAMTEALAAEGFGAVSCAELPLMFRCPADAFADHFRNFAARAAVILDRQDEAVLAEIYNAWESALEDFVMNGELQVPMPALAVSAVRSG